MELFLERLSTFLIMMVFNYIGDYPLQGDFLGKYKSESDYLLFVHCFIWTGVMSYGLHSLGILSWWKVLFLFIGHFIFDRLKARHKLMKTPKDEYRDEKYRLLYIDQALHLLQVLIVVF